MLVALIAGRPGPQRAAALTLLSINVLLAIGLFGAQVASPSSFLCSFFGADFGSLYASGRMVLAGRGAGVYDPAQRLEQSPAILEEAHSICRELMPAAYWLSFLLPVLPFTLLQLRPAYYLWTALNVILLAFALWRLARASGVSPWLFWFIGFSFYATIFGLLQGQLHAWQFLAFVEFWLALQRRADRAAGLWLSLQLVRPQLILLLPLYFLWKRRWRVFGWFAAGGLISVALTVLLAGGVEVIVAYLRLLRNEFVQPDSDVAVLMVNWRALSLIWFRSSGPGLMGITTVILTLVTLGLVFWSWQERRKDQSALTPRSFLALISAVLLTSYGTSVHSVVLLLAAALPFLAQLSKESGRMARLWSVWLDIVLLSPFPLIAVSLVFSSQVLLLLLAATLLIDAFALKVEKRGQSTLGVLEGSVAMQG